MTGEEKCRFNGKYALITLVLIEAAIIALLVASKTTLIIQPKVTPIMAVRSPLEEALDYESPDQKFEELVKTHSGWLPFRSQATDLPILATCAMLNKTNHIRILIAHGADVNESLKLLEAASIGDAAELLRAVASEIEKK